MNETVTILEACITGMLLWAFWYFGWKPYQLDKLRQKLFCIRDEFFLIVAKKEIAVSFQDEVYEEWRRYFNSSIRYSHMLSSNLILFATLFSKFNIWGEKIDFKNYKSPAETALEKIEDEGVKAKITEFKDQANFAFFRYLFATSPVFAVATVLACIAVLFGCICQAGVKSLSQAIDKKLKQIYEEPIKVIEAEAETSDFIRDSAYA